MGHQAESVHDDARVLDTPILQVVDDHAPDVHRPTSCPNTEKVAPMGTAPFEAARDLIALRNLLLDGEHDVGKGGTHSAQGVFQSEPSMP